jgi:predicted TIM-barrel fold metal-dependent hydrolase
MTVIDCYAQLGPGVANHRTQLVIPMDDTSTAAGLIASMDRVGIDRAMVFPPRWVGGSFVDPDYRLANAAIHDAVRAHPKRLVGYARVNPNFGEQAADELRHCFSDYGFRGLMLDPESENFDPGDQNLVYPLLEIARAQKVPVLFHSWYAPSEPALFWKLADDFPELPVIIGHMGGRLTVDAALIAERAPNVYLETSDHMYRLGNFAKRIGANRILFGTNTPFAAPEAELFKVTVRKDLTQEEKEMILGGNALRLHGLS